MLTRKNYKLFIILCTFFLHVISFAQKNGSTASTKNKKTPGEATQPRLIISELIPDFYIYQTFMEYKGEPVSANGMYVVTNAGVIMFDATWDPTQLQPLLDSIMTRHNKQVVLSIATHFHEDRAGGFDFLKTKGIKTYTTKLTDSILAANKKQRAEFLIYNDTVFTVGQYSFEIYYPGKGHSPDNIVGWFGKTKLLYGGCLVKSTDAEGLGNLSDADVKAWPQTIKNIQLRFAPRYIIPGHDSWNSTSALNHTLKLLKDYEKKKKD